MESFIEFGRALLNIVAAAHPAWLFVALAILPLAGVPTSPLWIAAGLRMGTIPGFILAGCALILNYTAGYWLARRWLRHWLGAWLEKRGWRLPQLSNGDETLVILLLRVTPGLPLFVQNYLLGLAEVNFARFLLLSLLVQAPQVLAFVWFGHSLADNAIWRLLLAAGALVALSLLVVLFRRILRRRAPVSYQVVAGTSQT